MRIPFLLLVLATLFQSCSTSKATIELDPLQSMVISGKGPGQDGTINPYLDTTSKAHVKNLGPAQFDIRVQNDGKIIDIFPIEANTTKTLILNQGDELYFDTDLATTTEVRFSKHR